MRLFCTYGTFDTYKGLRKFQVHNECALLYATLTIKK